MQEVSRSVGGCSRSEGVSQKRERLLHRVLQEVPGSAARCHVIGETIRGVIATSKRMTLARVIVPRGPEILQ